VEVCNEVNRDSASWSNLHQVVPVVLLCLCVCVPNKEPDRSKGENREN
jgi:hypothetical protein